MSWTALSMEQLTVSLLRLADAIENSLPSETHCRTFVVMGMIPTCKDHEETERLQVPEY